MAHQGKLIEHGLVAQLVAANTAAGDRVHRDRVDPLKKGGLPAIAIYLPSEELDEGASAGTAPRELTRIADVEFQLLVRGVDAEDVSDDLWDLQEQFEAAMDADLYIGGEAADSIYKRYTREIYAADGRGDPLIGVAEYVYSVTYRTTPGVSEAVDDFLRVKATHQIVGADDDNAAHDEFVVQETPP